MSSRADKFEQLHKSLKKHYKFTEDTTERSVLESLLYACCLEDARPDQAEEAFAKLQQTYFDWNEVRVTTTIELSEVLTVLPNPTAAGHRIKRCLQSIFETRYQYDLDDLKKANLTKATEDIQAWQGMTPFVLNYVSQHSLGGHAIPADTAILDALLAADILTTVEIEKKTIPGIERAIPKNKGFEFASLLHQFAVDFSANSKSAVALAVFKDLGVVPKAKVVPPPPAPKTSKKAPAELTSKPLPSSAEKSLEKPALKDAEKESKAPASDKIGKPKDSPSKDSPSKDSPSKHSPSKHSPSKAEALKSELAKSVKMESPKGDKKSPPIQDSVKRSGKADAMFPDAKSKDPKKPEATKPATNKPAANKPAANKPATNKSATNKPAANKPAANKPAAKSATNPTSPAKPMKGKADEKPPTKKMTKIAPTKGKSAPLSKAMPKAEKSENSSKKPAKMANNVKITKKKPK
jgi:hypothetical protein